MHNEPSKLPKIFRVILGKLQKTAYAGGGLFLPNSVLFCVLHLDVFFLLNKKSTISEYTVLFVKK